MSSETPKCLITDFINNNTTPMKRTSSMLSPPELAHDQKKPNIEEPTTKNDSIY